MPTAPSNPSGRKPKIFIAHNHRDADWGRRIRDRLRIEGTFEVQLFHDLPPSKDINLWKYFDDSDVVLLLLSPDFLGDLPDFITEKQGDQLPGLQKANLIRLIPVLLKQCAWMQVTWLTQLQIFPSPSVALSDLQTPALINKLNELTSHIEKAAREINRPTAPEPNAPPESSFSPGLKEAIPAPQPISLNKPGSGAGLKEPIPVPQQILLDDEEVQTSDISFDGLNESDFTDYAWNVLKVARLLGGARPRPGICSARTLVASLMLSGVDDLEGRYTGGWLVRQQAKYSAKATRRSLASRYTAIAGASFDELVTAEKTVAQTMTAGLKRKLDLARKLALESQPGKSGVRISARHLLGAAVSRTDRAPNVARLLRDFGLTTDEVRARLIEAFPDWGVSDDPEIWRRLVDKEDAAPEEQGLPTYAADSTTGPDLIGITREVEAMASLVSAWSVEPPLSIGLFGEWGSGKSFFMRRMQDRVRQIAKTARKSGLGQKEFGYYKNVVQVEFNAWHYVEGNLWASLVEHIFSNLRLEGGLDEPDADSEEAIKQRVDRLLGKVKEKTEAAIQEETKATDATKEAEEKKQQAEINARKLEEEAEAARIRAKTAANESRQAEQKAADKQREADASKLERDSLGLKDVIEEVTGSSEIRELAQKDLALLGVTPDRTKTIQGLRDALNEGAETATVIGEGIKILAEDNRRWWLLAWVAAGSVAAAALVWIGAWLTKQQHTPFLQSIIGTVSAIAAVMTGVIGFWQRYAPKLKPLVDAAQRLKKKRAELEKEVEKAREARAEEAARRDKDARIKREQAAAETKIAEQKIADAEQARQEAKEKEEAAHRANEAAHAARAEVEKLQQEVDALRPERRIAAFIQDRAGAKDYRMHLGVPALIRRDFEKLSAMFQTQRREETDGNDGHGPNAKNRNDLAIVNRIILYIDDLDRCPPDKVVEVLRAIHLLLAFPLFVVVVAVDARWMKRSLRDRFSLMLTSSPEAEDHNGATSKADDLSLGQMATPDDYLEKIFQVPFWIRPLNAITCKTLVTALTKDDLVSPDGKPVIEENKKAPDNTGEKPPVKTTTGTDAGDVNTPPSGRENTGDIKGAEVPKQTPVESEELFKWREVEPKPRALQLTEDERKYMIKLAPLIGRSPRSVKRFINCYRLLKAALDQDELAQVIRDGTFRTTMLLLGLMTGLPDVAPALLTDLRRADKTISPVLWIEEATKRLGLGDHERWPEVKPLIQQLHKESKVLTIRPLTEAATLIDRFSFSPVRSAQSLTSPRGNGAPSETPRVNIQLEAKAKG
jgi:KAP family P-loop domain